jgi:hypothetical protein
MALKPQKQGVYTHRVPGSAAAASQIAMVWPRGPSRSRRLSCRGLPRPRGLAAATAGSRRMRDRRNLACPESNPLSGVG